MLNKINWQLIYKLKINKEHIAQIKQSWSSQYGDSYQEGLHFLIEHLPTISKSVKEIVDEIITNKPVQQIIGEWPFYNGTYVINENVLIPRPETEVMIDHIINHIKYCKSVLDLGTGSGCIAIELSKIFSSACVHGVDKSVQALEVAKKNNHQTKPSFDYNKLDQLSEIILNTLKARRHLGESENWNEVKRDLRNYVNMPDLEIVLSEIEVNDRYVPGIILKKKNSPYIYKQIADSTFQKNLSNLKKLLLPK